MHREPHAQDQVASVHHDGVMTISGRHRTRWFHGMCTQNIKGLQPGDGLYAAIVNIKGKLLTDFQLYEHPSGDHFVLILPKNRIEAICEHLKRYIVAERVDLEDRSEQSRVISLFGPNAAAMLGDPAADATAQQIAAADVLVVRCNRTGKPGFDIVTEAGDLDTVIEALVDRGATAINADRLETARIEGAIPRYGVDMDDGVILLEACLHDAIHWDKGCYLGQEVLARMNDRGHTNRELRQLTLETSALPVPGAEIWPAVEAKKPCGWITSATHSQPEGRAVALGYVRRKHFEPGTPLKVVIGDMQADAVVSTRSIRDGGHTTE
jgi:folate-binding protein YgfZ